MENVYTIESLREKIAELEIQQKAEGKLLREEVLLTYDNLKPANLLRNMAKDLVSTDSLKKDLVETAAGLASGFITRKLITRNTRNPALKLVGLTIQMGIAALVSKNFDLLKNGAADLIQLFLKKEETETEASSEEIN